MSWIDLTGYLASLSVLATFCMESMLSLRCVAVLSNTLFITYGTAEHLYPVLLLHAVLLPINLLKIVQLRRKIGSASSADAQRVRKAAREIKVMRHAS